MGHDFNNLQQRFPHIIEAKDGIYNAQPYRELMSNTTFDLCTREIELRAD